MMRTVLMSCVALVASAAAPGTARAFDDPPASSAASTTTTPPTAAITPEQRDQLWAKRGCIDDDRGRWFRDAKFGAIIHFGPYSQLGGYYDGKGPYRPSEQIIGLGDRKAVIPPAEYREKVAGSFNPAKFDAAEWVRLMKQAGQKYVILTTKHHDGFCMFKTSTTPFNVVEQTPFARDVVKELAEECRKQGLVFCPYYSIGDWTAADVQNAGFASYKDYMHAQLRELLTNYGEIKLLWFDNWWYVNDQWKNDEEHAKDLYAFARTISPGTLVNDRCGSGAESTDGDYATPENQLKGSLQERYFEVVMTNTADDNWGWVKGATNYRKPAELIRNLIDSTSKGGNFVLNVGPMADGSFPPEHVAILEEMGKWLAVNGEGIYGTVAGPWTHAEPRHDGAVCYTTQSNDKNTIYVHVITWPENGQRLRLIALPSREWAATCLDASLGEVTIDQHYGADTASASISRPARLDPYATVIKLTGKTGDK